MWLISFTTGKFPFFAAVLSGYRGCKTSNKTSDCLSEQGSIELSWQLVQSQMIPKWYNGEVKFTVLSWNCFSYLLFVEYQPNRPWDIPILNNSGLYQCRLFSNYWNNNLLPSQQARLKGTCISEINANKYKKPGWIKKWNSWQEVSSLQLFTNIDQERNSACAWS